MNIISFLFGAGSCIIGVLWGVWITHAWYTRNVKCKHRWLSVADTSGDEVTNLFYNATDLYCVRCDALDLRNEKRLDAQKRAKQLSSGEPAKPGALSIVRVDDPISLTSHLERRWE